MIQTTPYLKFQFKFRYPKIVSEFKFQISSRYLNLNSDENLFVDPISFLMNKKIFSYNSVINNVTIIINRPKCKDQNISKSIFCSFMSCRVFTDSVKRFFFLHYLKFFKNNLFCYATVLKSYAQTVNILTSINWGDFNMSRILSSRKKRKSSSYLFLYII